MSTVKTNNLIGLSGVTGILYDNAVSGLTATSVQAAIDELKSDLDTIDLSATSVTYDNTTSGLTATNVKAALDELESEKLNKSSGTAQNLTIDAVLNGSGVGLTIDAATRTGGEEIAKIIGGLSLGSVWSVDSSGRVKTPYQPMFSGRGYAGNGNSPASNTLAFRWTTIEINQGNHFNNTTGIFTTPIAGTYEIKFHFNRRATATNWHGAYIFVNGVSRENAWFPPGPDSNYTYAPLSIGVVLQLSANDQIAFAYNTSYSIPNTSSAGNTGSIALIG